MLNDLTNMKGGFGEVGRFIMTDLSATFSTKRIQPIEALAAKLQHFQLFSLNHGRMRPPSVDRKGHDQDRAAYLALVDRQPAINPKSGASSRRLTSIIKSKLGYTAAAGLPNVVRGRGLLGSTRRRKSRRALAGPDRRGRPPNYARRQGDQA